MWQQIVTYLIGILAVTYVIVGIYRMVKRRNDPCAGCSGCDIKKEFERKRAENELERKRAERERK